MKQPPPGFEHVVLDKKRSTPQTCRNCGIDGHLHKDCPHPIMSFGIICYRKVGESLQYLMIQRKDSLSFMEFIRGKYKTEQVEYLKQLISCMTQMERDAILSTPFEELWNHVWYQPTIPKHTAEFLEAKRKFDTLKHGIHSNQTFVTLAELVRASPSPYLEPEWGFPKGRRRLREDDIDCAVREFSEETGCRSNDIQIEKKFPPFEEIFFGTNHVLYRHVYYIAEFVGGQPNRLEVDPQNINQAREVRAIRWFTFEQAMEHIRTHNRERKELFLQAHTNILQQLKG